MFSHVYFSHWQRSWYWDEGKWICIKAFKSLHSHHHISSPPKSYLLETNTHKGHLSDLSEKLDPAKPLRDLMQPQLLPEQKKVNYLEEHFARVFVTFSTKADLFEAVWGGREQTMGWLWSALTGWLRQLGGTLPHPPQMDWAAPRTSCISCDHVSNKNLCPKLRGSSSTVGQAPSAPAVTMKWNEGRQDQVIELLNVNAEEAALLASFMQCGSRDTSPIQQEDPGQPFSSILDSQLWGEHLPQLVITGYLDLWVFKATLWLVDHYTKGYKHASLPFEIIFRSKFT